MAKSRRDRIANTDPFSSPSDAPSLHDLTNSMVTSSDANLVTSDVYRDDGGNLIAYSFKLTPVGIDPNTLEQDKESWMQLAEWLFQMEGRLSLFIGDMLVGMERLHGITYEMIAEHFGVSTKTLYNWKYVCENVDISLRRENLKYSHYMLVAGKDAKDQERYLRKASEEDMSKSELKKLIDEEDDQELVEEKPPKFERDLENVIVELNQQRWKKLGKRKRKNYYAKLKNLLEQIETWGVD